MSEHCERCGKDVWNTEGEHFNNIDLAQRDDEVDYYDVCDECFTEYIALVRGWINPKDGEQ